MRGIFISGTDTGIGKTIVTATLCRILRARGIGAVAIKPFATGIGPETHWRENDPLILSAAMDNAEPPEMLAPVRLLQPLSPYDAARITGGSLDVDATIDAVKQIAGRHAYALIEGVGGVHVPLTENVMLSQFIKLLDLPALLVARSRVGTINHSLLSVGALRQAGVHVEGLVFTRQSTAPLTLDEKLGPETACRLGKTASFGLIEHSEDLANAASPEALALALPVNDPALQALADHLMPPPVN